MCIWTMSDAFVYTLLRGELENSDIGGSSKSVISGSTTEDKFQRDKVYNSIYNLEATILNLRETSYQSSTLKCLTHGSSTSPSFSPSTPPSYQSTSLYHLSLQFGSLAWTHTLQPVPRQFLSYPSSWHSAAAILLSGWLCWRSTGRACIGQWAQS